jgi:23S rRNA (uracil1939-C5)-methyltransferase
MSVRKGEVVEVAIEKMAFGGRGVGRVNGFVLFVRNAAPGDKITARVVRKKRDHGEAVLTQLLSPSPDRVAAPCPYSGHCGGCQWQHIRYDRQLAYKQDHVVESMERLGGLKSVRVHPAIPSERRFAYRNKMEFSFSDRRWFLPEEMNTPHMDSSFALGLHVPGTFNKVLDVSACLLQRETGNHILSMVREYAKASGLPVYGLKSHKGFWRFLMLRHSGALDQWMVNVVTSEPRHQALKPLADHLCGRIPRITSVVNNVNRRRASIAVGEQEIGVAGQNAIMDKIGPYHFHISANSFFQTNSRAAHELYRVVLEYADLKGSDTVLDLYSGTGTIPIFIADRVRTVLGMEMSRSAVEDALKNCRENGIDNCRFICGDIRREIHSLTHRPDALIIDPPRAGMHQDVLKQVLALTPERIVYVSCNPATLARDMGRMSDAYDLVEIQPVDMFPHTYHIEAVARLRLRKRTAQP